jgi:hypothetical protein
VNVEERIVEHLETNPPREHVIEGFLVSNKPWRCSCGEVFEEYT